MASCITNSNFVVIAIKRLLVTVDRNSMMTTMQRKRPWWSADKRVRIYLPTVLNSTPTAPLEKIATHSLQGFALNLKKYSIHQYSDICSIPNCYICRHNLTWLVIVATNHTPLPKFTKMFVAIRSHKAPHYYSDLMLSKSFQPIAAQLLMEPVLPLAKSLTTTSYRSNISGSRSRYTTVRAIKTGQFYVSVNQYRWLVYDLVYLHQWGSWL